MKTIVESILGSMGMGDAAIINKCYKTIKDFIPKLDELKYEYTCDESGYEGKKGLCITVTAKKGSCHAVFDFLYKTSDEFLYRITDKNNEDVFRKSSTEELDTILYNDKNIKAWLEPVDYLTSRMETLKRKLKNDRNKARRKAAQNGDWYHDDSYEFIQQEQAIQKYENRLAKIK